MDQRFAFDEVAELYDAERPSYPPQLVADVIAAADLTREDAMIEVGCGTGQATEAFARRGYDIVAVEPGAELARLARSRLARFPNAAVVQTSFEDWRIETGVFRVVIAAQSWHWLDPEVCFDKAADALCPGGVLAIFGHVPMPPGAGTVGRAGRELVPAVRAAAGPVRPFAQVRAGGAQGLWLERGSHRPWPDPVSAHHLALSEAGAVPA